MYQFLINPDNEVLLMIDAISGREEEPYAEYERSRRSLRLVKNPSETKLFSHVNKDVAEILNEKSDIWVMEQKENGNAGDTYRVKLKII